MSREVLEKGTEELWRGITSLATVTVNGTYKWGSLRSAQQISQKIVSILDGTPKGCVFRCLPSNKQSPLQSKKGRSSRYLRSNLPLSRFFQNGYPEPKRGLKETTEKGKRNYYGSSLSSSTGRGKWEDFSRKNNQQTNRRRLQSKIKLSW